MEGPIGSTGNECIFAKLSISSSSSWAELALFSVSPADGLHNNADKLHNNADGLHNITDVMIYNLVLIS